MPDLIKLFTTFEGRISRREWWLGTVILLAVSLSLTWLIAPSAFDLANVDPDREVPFELRLMGLVLLLPSLAIMIKRLNDRDQPAWLGLGAAGAFAAMSLAGLAGYRLNPLDMSLPLGGAFALYNIFLLWLFIDMGCLRGTRGANRHGPDPVAPTGEPTALPAHVASTGRTRGSWARDGLVAVTAVTWALSLFTPGIVARSMGDTLSTIALTLPGPPEEVRSEELDVWRVAHAAHEAGNDEDAIEHVTRAIAEAGADSAEAAPYYRQRAWLYRYMDRLDDALSDAERAVELDPDIQGGFSTIGRIQMNRGDKEAALAAYSQAVQRDPGDTFSHLERGDILKAFGRHEEALAAYEIGITLAERDRATFSEPLRDERGNHAEFRRGVRQRAAAYLANAHQHRAEIFRDTGREREALAEFNLALEANPQFVELYSGRGRLYEQQGELELARADYQRALELDPGDERMKEALERVE